MGQVKLMGAGWLGVLLVSFWCFIATLAWMQHKPAKETEEKEINLDDIRGAGL